MTSKVVEQELRETYQTPSYKSTTLDDYNPMEVPEHIYVTGFQPKHVRKESRPQMIVPSRITVAGGETTVASKAQPTEVLRERQTLLPAQEKESVNIGINGIPDTLTAAELPNEDITQNTSTAGYSPEIPHYASQTSIAVERDPVQEMKLMRRRLQKLIKRVENLEQDNLNYQNERPYILTGLGAGIILAMIVYLACRK